MEFSKDVISVKDALAFATTLGTELSEQIGGRIIIKDDDGRVEFRLEKDIKVGDKTIPHFIESLIAYPQLSKYSIQGLLRHMFEAMNNKIIQIVSEKILTNFTP